MTPVRARILAGAVCALEALVMVGFAVYYVVELILGEGEGLGSVLGSGAVIVLLAIGVGLLAWWWRTRPAWARTPTIVWNLLLVPVAISLLQNSAVIGGIAVAVLAAAGCLGALRGAEARDLENE